MLRLLTLIVLIGLCGGHTWAARGPLAEPALSKALQQLEEGSHAERVFRLQVAALAAHADDYPPDVQGRIARLTCWAMPAERDGEFRQVIAFADQALLLARQRKDLATEAGLLTCRAFHRQLLSQMDEAAADYERALQLAHTLGDRLQEADILSLRGEMHVYQGKQAEGLQELMAAHHGYQTLGLDNRGRETLGHIANAYRRMGLYERAESYYKLLAQEYEQAGDEERLFDILSQQGVLYSEMGQYQRARPLLERAEQFYRQRRHYSALPWVQLELATVLHQQGYGELAMAKLSEADGIIRSSDDIDSVMLGHWQLVMGMVLGAKGELSNALEVLAKAEPVFVRDRNPRLLARLYEVQSQLLEQQGDTQAALAKLKQYVKSVSSTEQALREQRSRQIRFEFDLARKELLDQTLKTKQVLQEAEIKQLKERRYWQYLVAGLLLVLMGIVVFYLYRRSRLMHDLAMTDDLTGISNRRQIQRLGENGFRQARAGDKPFSVLLLDIDYFKRINDELGHHIGDKVLIAVARCCEAQVRSRGQVGRNGGEEFLVLLPNTGLDDATALAEQIRYRVSLLKIDGLPAERATHVSIGCAQQIPADDNLAELVQRADVAMYRAKQAGRNQVMQAE